MLIGLVKDSFLRCFCHTCSVHTAIQGRRMHKKPLKKTNKKPKCKQPKRAKYYATTEIRCEEKSRGGMCYEVILADPCTDKPIVAAVASPRPKSMTAEEINQKLVQAEERRKSMEASRIASVAERLARLEEASKKREQNTAAFIATTHSALEAKLDATSSNREAYLNGLRAKVTEHLGNVEQVRKQLETQTEELRSAIELKLKSAEENRDENMKKMLDKLKEHEEYAQKVRLGHEEDIKALQDKISAKLEIAEAKRENEIAKKLESLREHANKVSEAQEIVNKKKENQAKLIELDIAAKEERLRKISIEKEAKRLEATKAVTEKLEQVQENKNKEEEMKKKAAHDKLEQKLSIAELKKQELVEKARKAKEENDRRAELVRANKERLMADEKHETASSG